MRSFTNNNLFYRMIQLSKYTIGKYGFTMNWSTLPSLSSLRTFAAVAEAGSFTDASTKLNVTRAAVGQQVRSLEKFLNVKLVERSGRGIELTTHGRSLAERLQAGFLMIERGIDEISGMRDDSPVRLTMSPAFAVEWLLPRLPEFERKNPDITLQLNPTADVIDLGPGGADIAIRYHDVSRTRAGAATVLISDMVVIGDTALVEGWEVDNAAALARLPWLQELGTSEVVEWFRRHGVQQPGPLRITEMPGNMIMQAVRRGDGLSYTARAFFSEDIERGRLSVLHSESAVGHYCIEVGPAAHREAVKRVLKWLFNSAETVTEQRV